MSEKPAQMTARPRCRAVAAASKADPSQRAEREIAELDQQMDLIMNKPENREALVNPQSNALQPPDGRSMTPGCQRAPILRGMTRW